MIHVLLYYKYVPIENPEQERIAHLALCNELGIKGRVILSSEGINGTVAGEEDAIEKYKEYMHHHPLFSDTIFKEDISEKNVFPRLQIRVRKEVVSLQCDDVALSDSASYIEPEDLKQLIESDEEFYLVDARNDYETKVGKFKNAVTLPIRNFRDLPKAVEEISHLKHKRIITYCTGGIRCEKASALLKEEGFENVEQLHGGIIAYGKKFPTGDFQGKCYVFDERITVEVNSPAYQSVIATCAHCQKPSDRYINCCNASCNKHFICCEACDTKMQSACSTACIAHSRYIVYKQKENVV